MTTSTPKLGKMNPKAQKFVPVAAPQQQIYKAKPPAADKLSQKLSAFGQSTTDIKEFQTLLFHLRNLDSQDLIPMDLFKKMGKLKICKDIDAFNFTVNPLITNRVVAMTVKNKKPHQRKTEGHRERDNRRSPTVAEDGQMVVGNELSNEDRKKRSELREHAKKSLFKASQHKNES
jgi:hypothetical protein